MNSRKIPLISALISTLFVVGCSGDENSSDLIKVHHKTPGLYINEECNATIDELALDDPVLIVNGEKITRRDFEALVLLRDRIWRIHQNVGFIASPSELNDFRYQVGNSAMLELIQRALFRQYAEANGIIPPQEKINEARKALLKSLRKSYSNMSDIADAIGGDAGKLFLSIPYTDAQNAMSRQSVTTNDLDNVSENEIKRRIDFVKRFDANAEAMNKLSRERLMVVKKRVLAGADIVEEAKNITDSIFPEYAKKWGTFEIQEFPPEEELHKWLLSAKPGEISDPLDTEDGIAIVKLVEKSKGKAPPGAPIPDVYCLVRCTVKACEKMKYQNPEEMKEQLLLWKRQDAQKALGVMLTEKAIIEYPNGTNLFNRIIQEEQK